MLKLKGALIFHKLPGCGHSSFCLKCFSQNGPKVTLCLSYFRQKICHQKLLNHRQSGYTACYKMCGCVQHLDRVK